MEANEIFFYVYDQYFNMLGVVDKFISLVWADRYDECGDFELVVPYDETYKDLLQKDRYCTTDYTNRYAIIEKIEIENDDEGKSKMTITGRSLEILLDRRIVISKIEIGQDEPENLEQAVKDLLTDNLIDPHDEKRKISDFVFVNSDDSRVHELLLSDTFEMDSLYEVLTDICQEQHIGFKLIVNDQQKYEFSLYKGIDLSNKVLFSSHYGNLNNSKYFSSSEDFKNVMVVSIGEEEILVVSNEEDMPTGLERREVHKPDSALKENSKSYLSNSELRKKAINELNSKYIVKTGFDGEIIPGILYTYLEDYNVGDKVMLEDEYDNNGAVYISEVVIGFDENGFSIVPTFKEIDWDDDYGEE